MVSNWHRHLYTIGAFKLQVNVFRVQVEQHSAPSMLDGDRAGRAAAREWIEYGLRDWIMRRAVALLTPAESNRAGYCWHIYCAALTMYSEFYPRA